MISPNIVTHKTKGNIDMYFYMHMYFYIFKYTIDGKIKVLKQLEQDNNKTIQDQQDIINSQTQEINSLSQEIVALNRQIEQLNSTKEEEIQELENEYQKVCNKLSDRIKQLQTHPPSNDKTNQIKATRSDEISQELINFITAKCSLIETHKVKSKLFRDKFQNHLIENNVTKLKLHEFKIMDEFLQSESVIHKRFSDTTYYTNIKFK